MRRVVVLTLVFLSSCTSISTVEPPKSPLPCGSKDEVLLEKIRRLCEELKEGTLDRRAVAGDELQTIGEPALPALREAIRSHDPEQRVRAKDVLDRIEWAPGLAAIARLRQKERSDLLPSERSREIAPSTMRKYFPNHRLFLFHEQPVLAAPGLLTKRFYLVTRLENELKTWRPYGSGLSELLKRYPVKCESKETIRDLFPLIAAEESGPSGNSVLEGVDSMEEGFETVHSLVYDWTCWIWSVDKEGYLRKVSFFGGGR